jgi:hypothetical protein
LGQETPSGALTPVVLGELAVSFVLAHGCDEHLSIVTVMASGE